MNITVVKNSTTITIIEDYLFKLRRDGGINTVEIHFYYPSPDLLDRWDRVTLNGATWRVAEQPTVKVNYETTADWLYTVTLIESAAILKGIQMPNIAFTQDLNTTKTIEDALETILLKQSVRVYNQAPRYTLASSMSVSLADLNKLAPNETFENRSLYEILSYYGELIDARPILDESDDTIDFTYLNDDNGIILTPTFITIEKSKLIEDFATDLIEDVTNAHVDKALQSEYPSRGTKAYYIPLDLAENVGFDNITLDLPFKIKKVIKMTMEAVGYAPVIILTSEPDGMFLTDKFIYEKKEWETLPKSSTWSWISFADWGQIRENCIYYEYGSYTIHNLAALKYHMTNGGLATYHPHILIVKVEYEALPDVEIRKSTNVLLDGDITYTSKIQQQSSTVDFKAESTRVETELRNRQSDIYNVQWVQSTLPDVKSKVTVLNDTCLITNMTARKVGGFYEINAKLATQYNRKNILTKAINENRIYEIPRTQITIRKVVDEINAKIEMSLERIPTNTGRWTNWRHNFLFSFAGWPYVNKSAMMFAEFEYMESSDKVAVALPCTTILDGDTLVIVTRMTSNTACDWQSYRDSTIPTNYTASSAIVTDKNGENRNVKLKFVLVDEDTVVYNDGVNDFKFYDIYPFVSDAFFDNGTITLPVTTLNEFELFDKIALYKDAREQLQFENRIKIIGIGSEDAINKNETEVNLDNLMKVTKLRQINSANYNIIMTINAFEHTVADTISFYDGYIRLDFTYPATGTLTKIELDYVGNTILSRDVTKLVTNGENGYLTIHIEG